MKRTVIISALAATVALALAASLAGAVGSNGSFEDGDDPGASFSTPGAGDSTTITGWTVGIDSVDYIGGYWQSSPEGGRSIDLNGNEQGSVFQTITTVVGATYTVTFDLSGNPEGLPLLKVVTVSATGSASQNFSYDIAAKANTNDDMKWEPQLYSFMATSASTTVTFASAIPGAYGPALDNVVVTETLPTAVHCKKDGWKTMIDSLGNTFKNQGDCVSFFATDGKNPGAGTL